MRLRRTLRGCLRRTGPLWATAIAAVGLLTVAGCGSPTAAASKVVDCGTSRTAANVPVEIVVYHGSVACAQAMAVEKGYAQAIVSGRVAGNGGGAPIAISGWTCQGFSTPEVLKTGHASRCTRNGAEIMEVLKT